MNLPSLHLPSEFHCPVGIPIDSPIKGEFLSPIGGALRQVVPDELNVERASVFRRNQLFERSNSILEAADERGEIWWLAIVELNERPKSSLKVKCPNRRAQHC